jgi:hypothetical protein
MAVEIDMFLLDLSRGCRVKLHCGYKVADRVKTCIFHASEHDEEAILGGSINRPAEDRTTTTRFSCCAWQDIVEDMRSKQPQSEPR